MRYAAIDTCECINAIGWGATLYVQGCSHHCIGCFNPETWDFDRGKKYTQDIGNDIYNLFQNKPWYTHFVVEGGEPLEIQNWKEINSLLTKIKLDFPHIKIWIYTGYTYEELLEFAKSKYGQKYLLPILISLADVIVDGPFIQEERDITLAFKGSKNQRIIDVRQTISKNKIILYNI